MGEGQPEQDFFSDNNVIQKKEKKKPNVFLPNISYNCVTEDILFNQNFVFNVYVLLGKYRSNNIKRWFTRCRMSVFHQVSTNASASLETSSILTGKMFCIWRLGIFPAKFGPLLRNEKRFEKQVQHNPVRLRASISLCIYDQSDKRHKPERRN